MAGNEAGFQGFIYYILAYALTNLGAFAVVIALENAGEERFDIQDMQGFGWRHPLLGAAMAVFMFSLAGVPPFAGFFAKFLVFTAAYRAGYWWLALIGLVTSVISAFYYLRIIVNMYMRDREQPARTFATAPLLIGCNGCGCYCRGAGYPDGAGARARATGSYARRTLSVASQGPPSLRMGGRWVALRVDTDTMRHRILISAIPWVKVPS